VWYAEKSMQPYRELVDRLGDEEREQAAIEMLGRWRMLIRARCLTAACFVGVVTGVIGIWALIHLQFALSMRASMMLAVVFGFGAPFSAAVGIGLAVARRLIAAGLERKLSELAAGYRIDPDRLRTIAHLVAGL